MDQWQHEDPEITALIQQEENRLEETLDLIAAESHAPQAIMAVNGSILTTKTIEGYPGRRFHAGCSHVDEIEKLAIKRGMALFGAEHANVQPHSGTSANLAVYFSVLDLGDTILAMDLASGGHLSHGHQASITSRCFQFHHYGVDADTGFIDYAKVDRLAQQHRPRMIVAGASAYPRLIDYEKMACIAKKISAYLFTDMAHIAGLVAAGVVESPVPHCDFVTFTLYKTMMAGRGGVILCRKKFAKQIDRTIFPGCQGTSAVNQIAAKAVGFHLAGKPHFVALQQKTTDNAKTLAVELSRAGFPIVTGGTDNHQVIVDLSQQKTDGFRAEKLLESVGIVLNRNTIPRDYGRKGAVSGIRIGTSAVTTRGMGNTEMAKIARLIDTTLKSRAKPFELDAIKLDVLDLCRCFPVYREHSDI